MATKTSARSTAHVLDRLAEKAARRDVPAAVADEARSVTCRVFGLRDGTECGSKQRRRIEAYYWAVVKRRVLRGGVAPRAAARLLAAAVVADLRSAGRDRHDIWRELQRGWGERLPEDVLEEYRLALCA
jgi:hypothetical protein